MVRIVNGFGKQCIDMGGKVSVWERKKQVKGNVYFGSE
nr:MAG TPA: hypothetical protein [Caudoviricetes sp.]